MNLPPYEIVIAKDGTQVHPGDRVHILFYPRGSGVGTAVIHPRFSAIWTDEHGTNHKVPRLSVDVGGVLYPMPGIPKRARR